MAESAQGTTRRQHPSRWLSFLRLAHSKTAPPLFRHTPLLPKLKEPPPCALSMTTGLFVLFLRAVSFSLVVFFFLPTVLNIFPFPFFFFFLPFAVPLFGFFFCFHPSIWNWSLLCFPVNLPVMTLCFLHGSHKFHVLVHDVIRNDGKPSCRGEIRKDV